MPDFEKNKFSQRLRNLRKDRGFGSQDAFAKAADIAKGKIASYEAGQSIPPIPNLVKIVNALGISLEKLIYGVDSPDQSNDKEKTKTKDIPLLVRDDLINSDIAQLIYIMLKRKIEDDIYKLTADAAELNSMRIVRNQSEMKAMKNRLDNIEEKLNQILNSNTKSA